MPHDERYANKLLRDIGLPARVRRITPALIEKIEAIVFDPRYWDETVLERLLDRCDDVLFRDPQSGLKIARIAPQVAQAISARRRPGADQQTPEQKRLRRDLLVRAYASLGDAYRVAGRPHEAEKPFQEASEIVNSEAISRSEGANLYRRLAALRACQKRHEDGLELAEKAVEIDRSLDSKKNLAWSLTVVGYVYVEALRFPEAFPSLGEALNLVTWKSAPRIYHAATHNMAYVISQTGRLDDLDQVRIYIRRARKCAGRGWSVPKAKLLWIDGKALLRSHFTPLAERRFKRALEVLRMFRAPFDVALVSLDLTVLYLRENRWRELEELAKETYRLFRELSADSEAIAALSLWLTAARKHTLTADLIADVAATVVGRMSQNPLPHPTRRR
ncbi:MAG: tetratricopeptide repeat protein [bacterium]|nr:tetratricopeptide repeat protein [bacterium]